MSKNFSKCIFVINYFTFSRIAVVLRQKGEVNIFPLPELRQNSVFLFRNLCLVFNQFENIMRVVIPIIPNSVLLVIYGRYNLPLIFRVYHILKSQNLPKNLQNCSQ